MVLVEFFTAISYVGARASAFAQSGAGIERVMTSRRLRQQAGRAVPISEDIGTAVAKEGAKRGINQGPHGSHVVP